MTCLFQYRTLVSSYGPLGFYWEMRDGVLYWRVLAYFYILCYLYVFFMYFVWTKIFLCAIVNYLVGSLSYLLVTEVQTLIRIYVMTLCIDQSFVALPFCLPALKRNALWLITGVTLCGAPFCLHGICSHCECERCIFVTPRGCPLSILCWFSSSRYHLVLRLINMWCSELLLSTLSDKVWMPEW